MRGFGLNGTSQQNKSLERFSLKKPLTLSVLTLSLLFTVAAEAQEFLGAVGYSGIKAPAESTNSAGITFPSLSGGIYPSVSGIFISTHHHIGLGGQVAVRAQQGVYTESSFTGVFEASLRPILYNFDAVYGRRFRKRFGADAMAGLGGMYLSFSTPYYTCGFAPCTNYTTNNHIGGHIGADFRYYVWRKVFVRPEIHYYLIRNNIEFNGANFARFAVSVGYSFRSGS
jgi:hypothetical protein